LTKLFVIWHISAKFIQRLLTFEQEENSLSICIDLLLLAESEGDSWNWLVRVIRRVSASTMSKGSSSLQGVSYDHSEDRKKDEGADEIWTLFLLFSSIVEFSCILISSLRDKRWITNYCWPFRASTSCSTK
jgi:hypothetical protein